MKNKKQVSVYLNTKEHEYVQSEAEKNEVGISEYIRQIILKRMTLSEMNEITKRRSGEFGSEREFITLGDF